MPLCAGHKGNIRRGEGVGVGYGRMRCKKPACPGTPFMRLSWLLLTTRRYLHAPSLSKLWGGVTGVEKRGGGASGGVEGGARWREWREEEERRERGRTA